MNAFGPGAPAAVPPASPFDVLEVVRVEQMLAGGQSRPLLVRVTSTSGARFVYKATFTHPTATPEGLGCARELLCSTLARDCGLRVPEPAILVVPSHLIDGLAAQEVPPPYLPRLLANADCPAFGSRFLGRSVELTPTDTISTAARAAALGDILAFDLLVANADRLPGNTNLRVDGGFVHSLDYGLAAIGDCADDARLSAELTSLHLAAALLREWHGSRRKGNMFVPSQVFTRWEAMVTDARIDELVAAIPPAWDLPAGSLARCASFLKARRALIPDLMHDFATAVQP